MSEKRILEIGKQSFAGLHMFFEAGKRVKLSGLYG